MDYMNIAPNGKRELKIMCNFKTLDSPPKDKWSDQWICRLVTGNLHNKLKDLGPFQKKISQDLALDISITSTKHLRRNYFYTASIVRFIIK